MVEALLLHILRAQNYLAKTIRIQRRIDAIKSHAAIVQQ